MFGRRIKRDVPEINATSTADMAFMLLVFFLLATSMGSRKSIRQELAPPVDSTRVAPLQVKTRDLLIIRLDKDGQTYIGDEAVAASDIKTRVKRFIENPTNNPDMPERHERELPLIGRTQVTDTHVIALQYDSRTNYKAYFSIQNQLREAYRELREAGTQTYFHCSFDEASVEQQEVIRACYPQRISETMLQPQKGENK